MEYLEKFKTVSQKMMADEDVSFEVLIKKQNVQHAVGTFTWKVVNVEKFREDLPENIESIWIFIVKPETPTGEHYHPNSIQHTVLVEGEGMVKIEGITQELEELKPIIIPEKIPHEFFPTGPEPMVLFSFHTAPENYLTEVQTSDGKQRKYER